MTGDINTWSKTAGSNATADPDIGWAEGMSPSGVNNSARAMMAAIANDRDDTRGALALTGGTTAYLVTTNAVNAAYFNGLEVWGKVNATSTGSVTLNVDGLGAKKVYDNGSTVATQLGAGGLTINEHAGFQYDSAADGGVGGFIKISNPGIASTAIAANSITNAQLVNMAANTVKGRITASTGAPEDLTAANLLTILNLPAVATAAQIWANTADKTIDTDAAWSSAAPVTVTYAASVALDFGTFINAKMTLTGNLSLTAPTNTKAGQSGCIALTQDGTGSRTLTFASNYIFANGVDFVGTTTASATDYLFYYVPVAGTVLISAVASGS